jgi:hypothetical protein
MKHFSVELWSINRILRYTGWRLYLEIDPDLFVKDEYKPTRIGFQFYGWSFLKG